MSSAQLDIHWSELLPELERPRDRTGDALRDRFESVQGRREEAADEASQQADVISISWIRRRRMFRSGR